MMVQEVWSIFQHQGDEQSAAPVEMLEGLVVDCSHICIKSKKRLAGGKDHGTKSLLEGLR